MVLLLMDFDSENANEMQVNTSGELSGGFCIHVVCCLITEYYWWFSRADRSAVGVF